MQKSWRWYTYAAAATQKVSVYSFHMLTNPPQINRSYLPPVKHLVRSGLRQAQIVLYLELHCGQEGR